MSEEGQKLTAAHATPEMAALIYNLHSKKAKRSTVRRQLFWIRDGLRQSEITPGLKEFIQLQFKGEMDWEGFTFSWDVARYEPLKVITPMEWTMHGGELEEVVEAPGSSHQRKVMVCKPAAFTRQGKVFGGE